LPAVGSYGQWCTWDIPCTDHAVFVCTIYSTAGHGWYSADSLRPFTCRRPSRTLAGIPRPLCWPRQFNVNATLRCLSSDPRAGHRRRHGQMERGSLQPQQCSLRQWLCYMAQHSCSWPRCRSRRLRCGILDIALAMSTVVNRDAVACSSRGRLSATPRNTPWLSTDAQPWFRGRWQRQAAASWPTAWVLGRCGSIAERLCDEEGRFVVVEIVSQWEQRRREMHPNLMRPSSGQADVVGCISLARRERI
jgi:hypothetical protein